MATRAQRKLIRAKIESGSTPQQVYDELKGPGNAADEQLADAVRYVPTLERRAQYKTAQWVLMALLAAAALWKFVFVLPSVVDQGWLPIVFHGLFGLAYVVAMIAVALYWRRAHTLAGLLGFMEPMHNNDTAFAENMAVILLLGVLMILGFYLQRELSPDYIKLKENYTNAEGQTRLREVVRFGD